MSPRLRKQAVVMMRSEIAVSERRACGLIQIHRGTYRYRRRPEDGQLRVRLRELAEERRRFGYLSHIASARTCVIGDLLADIDAVCVW